MDNFIPWKECYFSHIVTHRACIMQAQSLKGERAYNGKIFKSEEHTKRFFKSAEIIGIKIPYSHEASINTLQKKN